MNYKESKKILKEIKRSRSILINCHRNPDPDSMGSALALMNVLRGLKKKITVICPTELDKRTDFLPGYEKVKIINFSKYDFNQHDLFLCLDSGSWGLVSGDSSLPIIEIPTIIIDHHWNRDFIGNINLVDSKMSSVGELLFNIIHDWKMKIDKKVATCLLTAMIGDTGSFRFSNTTYDALTIAGKLMKLGADKYDIIFNLYGSHDFKYLQFTAEILKKIEIDKRNRFVWAAIPYRVYNKYSHPADGKELAGSIFAQSTKGTDFGIVMLETERGNLSISFRSRTDIDVSKLAVMLNGGGHKAASGGKVVGLSFGKAVKKVLREARKFAKEQKR